MCSLKSDNENRVKNFSFRVYTMCKGIGVPQQAQRVPGVLGSQIFMTFGT
jgi:hypothetical protein